MLCGSTWPPGARARRMVAGTDVQAHERWTSLPPRRRLKAWYNIHSVGSGRGWGRVTTTIIFIALKDLSKRRGEGGIIARTIRVIERGQVGRGLVQA